MSFWVMAQAHCKLWLPALPVISLQATARHGLLLLLAEAQTSKNLHPPAHGQNLLVLNLLWLNAGVLAAVAHLDIAARLVLTA
jgi:hypothetical protein